MSKISRKFTVVLVVLCVAAFSLYAKKIIVFHTSDVHGWYKARPAKSDKANPQRLTGGFAALSALVKKEKNPYLLVDSGDWFQGTAEGVITKGAASVILMNELGYTAGTLGNHEYDFGEENLKKILKKAKFSVLAANIEYKDKSGKIDYAKPYIVKKIDGIKIAIIGLASPRTKTSTFPPYVKHLDFLNPPKICAKYVKKLKDKADAVLVLTHIGLCDRCIRGKTLKRSEINLTSYDYKNGNIKIAGKCKGDIAVLFGGHNHMMFEDGYYDKKSGTLFIESGGELTHISRVELEFDDETNEFISAKSDLIPLWTDETGGDKKVLKEIEKIEKEIGKKLDKVIARADSDMALYETDLDTSLGSWICDIMAETTDTAIAFQNSRGIRADIFKGNVTLRDMYKVIPFENTLVTLNLTGSQITDIIKASLTNGISYMQISGLKVLYTTNTDGKPDKIKVLAGGDAIDENKSYRIVTNSYLASGGTGGRIFLQAKNIKDTAINIRQAIVDYLNKNPVIEPPLTGRIKEVTSL